jgi:hypothetical protein
MSDINNLKQELALQKQIQEQLRDRQQSISKLKALGDDASESEKRRLKILKESQAAQQRAYERTTDTVKDLQKTLTDYNKAMAETKGILDDMIPGLGSLVDAFKKNDEGVTDFKKNLKDLADNAANASIRSNAKLTKSFEEVNVSLAKQTGFSTALRQDVLDLATSHDGLFLTMDEGAKVVGALTTGFRMYAAQNAAARKQTNSLAGRFQTLGVDVGVFSQALDQLNDGFGLTRNGAISAMAEFENLSIRTGQPLSAVINDFKDLGPQMARFGADGVRVFTELTNQARTLGLTTRQAFDFGEMFDTFEGAADVAGKLNAQLGLQLNSVEMMATSHEDRLKILRAEFDMRGVHMKDMGRRQKQMVAEILKTDVVTAEKLLGDPMALRKFQREEANNEDRINKFTTAMTKFSQLGEQLFINIAPVFNFILEGLNGIATMFNEIFSNQFAGVLISALTIVGSVFFKMNKIAGIFSTTMGALMARLAPFMAIFVALKDISEAFGFGEGGAGGQDRGLAKVIGGTIAAVIGGILGTAFFGIGAPVGAAIGYGLGSFVTGLVVDDAADLGGAFAHSAPGGAAAKPMVRGAAAPMSVQPGLRDRTTVSRKDGALDRMLKAQEESNRISNEIKERLGNLGGQKVVLDSGELVGKVLAGTRPV